jgi:hypothetical protein
MGKRPFTEPLRNEVLTISEFVLIPREARGNSSRDFMNRLGVNTVGQSLDTISFLEPT